MIIYPRLIIFNIFCLLLVSVNIGHAVNSLLVEDGTEVDEEALKELPDNTCIWPLFAPGSGTGNYYEIVLQISN